MIKLAPSPDGPPPLGATAALPGSAAEEPSATEPAAPASSAPSGQPTGADNSTAMTRPATAGLAAGGLSLEAAPPPGQSSRPPTSVPATAGTSGTRVDRNVVQTSSEDPKLRVRIRKSVYKEPGRPVGRVGDEIISYHDLIAAFKDKLRKYPQLAAKASIAPNRCR